MEQIEELLNILSKTPEMAIWGISIYFAYILLKLASWVLALKVVIQQFIKRYFDYREKQLSISKANDLIKMFEKNTSCNSEKLIELLSAVKVSANTKYGIYTSDIDAAIKILKENKVK